MDKIDYEEIYEQCNIICPEMRSVTAYIRNISTKNNGIKNTLKKIKSGDTSAIKRFIELYLKTALQISLSAAKESGLPLDELFSEAVSAISKHAIDLANQKIKNGVTVSALIKKRLQKYIFEHKNYISLEEVRIEVSYDVERFILKRLCMPELHELINEALYSLPGKFETILNMRYGINDHKYTVKQIAKKYNLSKQSIYVAEKNALKKLRESEKYSEILKMYLDI